MEDGQIDENYAVLYQEFLLEPMGREDAEKIAEKLFTSRLYCDDPKVREVIVCHSQLAEQEIYPCVKGVAIREFIRKMQFFCSVMKNSVVMHLRYTTISKNFWMNAMHSMES